MARKTRAAARAEQAEAEIHVDDTQTEAEPAAGQAQTSQTTMTTVTLGEKVASILAPATRQPLQETSANVAQKEAVELASKLDYEIGSEKRKKSNKNKKRNANRKKAKKNRDSISSEPGNSDNAETLKDASPVDAVANPTPDVVNTQPEPAPEASLPAPTISAVTASPTRRTRATAKMDVQSAAEDKTESAVPSAPESIAEPVKPAEIEPSVIVRAAPSSPTKHKKVKSVASVQEELFLPNYDSAIEATPKPKIEAEQPIQTPHKLDSLFQAPQASTVEPKNVDFIAEIIARSPAKPSERSRAREDPFDALDALEDAEDAMRALSRTRAETMEDEVADAPATKPTKREQPKAQSRPVAVQKPAPSAVKKAAETVKPTATAARHSRIISQKDVPRIASSAVAEQKAKAPIAALSTPPRVFKSTKPVTKPSFSLTSDAVHERVKAAREERQKRREEEEQKRKVQKPQPTLKARPIEIKDTAASRARASIVPATTDPKTPAAAESKGTNRQSTLISTPKLPAKAIFSTASTVSRTVSGGKPAITARSQEPLIKAGTTKVSPAGDKKAIHAANTARPRAPLTVIQRLNSKAQPAKQNQDNATAKPTPVMTKMTEAERQEAAKKARVEAAERGRAASREWAEKMKQKSLSSSVSSAKEQIQPTTAA